MPRARKLRRLVKRQTAVVGAIVASKVVVGAVVVLKFRVDGCLKNSVENVAQEGF